MRAAEVMARTMNTERALGLRSIEVSGLRVPRFRVAVVDERDQWVHLAHGVTSQQARAQAELWLADEPAVVH